MTAKILQQRNKRPGTTAQGRQSQTATIPTWKKEMGRGENNKESWHPFHTRLSQVEQSMSETGNT